MPASFATIRSPLRAFRGFLRSVRLARRHRVHRVAERGQRRQLSLPPATAGHPALVAGGRLLRLDLVPLPLAEAVGHVVLRSAPPKPWEVGRRRPGPDPGGSVWCEATERTRSSARPSRTLSLPAPWPAVPAQ